MFDGDPSEPNYQSKIDFSKTFAFHNYHLIRDPLTYEFSSIDMTRKRRIPKTSDYFSLIEFSAKWDPVPTMLTQNHTQLVKAFMGQTTSFDRNKVKPSVLVMGENKTNREARYIHGTKGKGVFYLLWRSRSRRLHTSCGRSKDRTRSTSYLTWLSINTEQRPFSLGKEKKAEDIISFLAGIVNIK